MMNFTTKRPERQEKMSKRKKRDLIVRLIEDAIMLYLMFACCWSICWLVGEIFEKMGVA